MPGNKSPSAEPVAGGHIPSGGIDALERVVEVQDFLPQQIHHLFRHRQILGREIHGGRERVAKVQGFLLQAAHHFLGHYRTLGEIGRRERFFVVQS